MELNKWDLIYLKKETPWDSGTAEPIVIDLIRKMKKKGEVVDLGCGSGNESIALAKLGFSVMGYDISKLAVKEAKKKARNLENVKFHVSDVLKISTDKKFDIVLDKACFHFIKPNKRKLYVKKVYSLLKDEGFFALLVASKNEKTKTAYTFSKSQIKNVFSSYFKILNIKLVKLKTHKEKRTPYMCLMVKKLFI